MTSLLDVEDHGTWRVIRLHGNLDIYAVSALRGDLTAQLDHHGRRHRLALSTESGSRTEIGMMAGYSPEGSHHLQQATGRASGAGVVLDLTSVPFVDSSGLGLLVGVYRRARDAGLVLRLVSTSAMLQQMLAMTGLERLLPLAADLDAATRLS